VKVLDFGLAKAFVADPSGSGLSPMPSILPTVTTGGTQAGAILGTAHYMSPEQARGQFVDRRSDIWAFGCILYEMLTGRLLFPGATVSDTIAAVLRADVDLKSLPTDTPESVRHILERCLDRDTTTRLRDIGEARVVLANPRTSSAVRIAAGGAIARRGRGRWLVPVVGLAALAIGFLAGRRLTSTTPRPDPPVFSFAVGDTSRTLVTGSLALSPDGMRLVYARRGVDGVPELLLHGLDQNAIQVLPGTRDGRQPFWSPDGHDIGFFSGNQLLRVSSRGGAATQIATFPDRPMGGTWNAAGIILVGTNTGPIYRVAAQGGAPEALTQLEAGVEDGHVWPAFLPDGEHYLYLADGVSDEGHRLTIRSLHGKDSKVIRKGVRSQILVDPRGALLMDANRQLFATPFDFGKMEFAGPQALVEDNVQTMGQRHELPLSLAPNGVMAFQRGNDAATIARVPLDGSPARTFTPPDRFRNPRIYKDGKQIAYEIQSGGDRTIWSQDLERGTRTLISVRGFTADSPAWSADGEWIYFDTAHENRWAAYRKRVQGGLPPELVGAPEGNTDMSLADLSSDGRWLLVGCGLGDGGIGLYLGSLANTPIIWTQWVNTKASEEFARFSPDSRWIAFQSDTSGQDEVYVAPVEGGPAVRQWMVSRNGGTDPAWSPDGTRLYYRNPTNMLMLVPITISGDRVEAHPPEPLLELHPPEVGYLRNAYDPTPDGKAIIAFVQTQVGSPEIRIRTDWRAR
jgi:Tol biopolymer transport system component